MQSTQPSEELMPKKRELIQGNNDTPQYVRRDEKGQFEESEGVGRSLSQDQKRDAKTTSKPGQGDKGDRKASGKSK